MGYKQCRNTGLLNQAFLQSGLKDVRILSVDDKPLKQFGMFKADLRVTRSNVARNFTIVVCHGLSQSYLSLDVCKVLKIVGQDFPNPQIAATKALKEDLAWPRAEREAWISSLPSDPSQEDFGKVSKKLKDVYA